MSNVTDHDLEKLKDLIIMIKEESNGRLMRLEDGHQRIKRQMSEIDDELTKLNTSQQIFKLEMGEIKSQLAILNPKSQEKPISIKKKGKSKNWKQIGVTLLSIAIGLILGNVIVLLLEIMINP